MERAGFEACLRGGTGSRPGGFRAQHELSIDLLRRSGAVVEVATAAGDGLHGLVVRRDLGVRDGGGGQGAGGGDRHQSGRRVAGTHGSGHGFLLVTGLSSRLSARLHESTTVFIFVKSGDGYR